MPQKDTALTLAQAARSFIASCNAALAGGRTKTGGADPEAGDSVDSRADGSSAGGCAFLIPRFPLFAFADALPDGGFCACRIRAPEREGREFFFPVELETRSAEEAGGPAGDGGTPGTQAVGESPVPPAEEGGKHALCLRIVFAELEGETTELAGDVAGQPAWSGSEESTAEKQPCLPELPQEYACRECFPLRPRVFRTGRVEYSGCSWEVWDERWQKLLP